MQESGILIMQLFILHSSFWAQPTMGGLQIADTLISLNSHLRNLAQSLKGHENESAGLISWTPCWSGTYSPRATAGGFVDTRPLRQSEVTDMAQLDTATNTSSPSHRIVHNQ